MDLQCFAIVSDGHGAVQLDQSPVELCLAVHGEWES